MRSALKTAISYALFRLPHPYALRLARLVLLIWPGFRSC